MFLNMVSGGGGAYVAGLCYEKHFAVVQLFG